MRLMRRQLTDRIRVRGCMRIPYGVPSGVVGSGNIPAPSGPDAKYHQYRVTITPDERRQITR